MDNKTNCTFLGCLAADQLSTIQPKPFSAVIINTDPSTKPGRHWVCMFFTHNLGCEFFDSFAQKPKYYNLYWPVWIRKYCSSLKCNSRVVQSINANTCGAHCLFFIYHRFTNYSMDDIIKTLYSDNLTFNDQYVELDIERHLNVDIIIDDSLFNSVPQKSVSKNVTLV